MQCAGMSAVNQTYWFQFLNWNPNETLLAVVQSDTQWVPGCTAREGLFAVREVLQTKCSSNLAVEKP